MLKNYTSSVPAEHSIAFIEAKLVRHGATNIMKTYADKKLTGIAFILPMKNGRNVPIRLPARVDRVEKILRADVRRPSASTYERIAAQAQRTAWKILADWVDAQTAMISLEQVEPLEIFLAFVFDPAKERTLFESMREGGFKQLPASATAPQEIS